MIDKYSYCLGRSEAKEIKIQSELNKINDETINQLQKKYKRSFDNTKDIANKFQSYQLLSKILK